jgi:hypothetical protein
VLESTIFLSVDGNYHLQLVNQKNNESNDPPFTGEGGYYANDQVFKAHVQKNTEGDEKTGVCKPR